MRDAVLADEGEDQRWIDLAKTDVGAGNGRDRPWKAPPVAVKHRQRPQIHRVPRHAPAEDIANRVEVRAAMVVGDALGIPGRARGGVERDGVPGGGGGLPWMRGVAGGGEGLIMNLAEPLAGP